MHKIISKILALVVLILTMPNTAHAQLTEVCLGRVITVMDFRNSVRISGTDLAVGATYRFSNVTTGVDARVTIDALNNGATLSTIDRDSGLIANFQPELVGNGVRSADFTIRFYIAGTTTPISLDFVGTGIDIDGDNGSLREYAEFSSPFAEYRLNNPTNLDVNASGPSVAGNFRFEARTPATAPGIDPTATQNIAAVFYSQRDTFRYRIGTLGTGSTTRLTSLDFSCPNLPSPTPVPIGPQDFGDAPASYGNPVHDIIAGIRMGTTNTSENGPYNNANANADIGDDGVVFSSLVQSQPGTATINVVGPAGILQAWVDWNGDGDFLDAGEQIATNVRDNQSNDFNSSVGIIAVNFTVPVNAVTTRTFSRFRWSSQTGLPPATIIARDGEVEDYALTVTTLIANVTPQKLSNVISDPINGSTNPKAIPGATINYCILVSNNGNATAENVNASDTLPATVSYLSGSMKSGADCGSATTVEDDDENDNDETDPIKASTSGANIEITASSLAPSASFAITFQVFIN